MELNITPEGLVTGLFGMHDSQGFPLSMALSLCDERGLTVDWDDYLRSAKKAGWKFEKTKAYVEDAIWESGYGLSFDQICRQVFEMSLIVSACNKGIAV